MNKIRLSWPPEPESVWRTIFKDENDFECSYKHHTHNIFDGFWDSYHMELLEYLPHKPYWPSNWSEI